MQSEKYPLEGAVPLLRYGKPVHEGDPPQEGDSPSWTGFPYWLGVYLRVIFFGTPYTCVMCGIRQCNSFSCGEIILLVHSLLKYFFKFQLWSWIQLYTTKYSNLILIFRYFLVWIFGSTYREGEILKQKWHVNSQLFHCYMRYTLDLE